MPGKAMMTVHGEKGPPTLAQAAEQLKVPVDAVDASFGVILVDPRNGLYSVQVEAAQLPPEQAGQYRGPFSDPQIETFGPVQTEPDSGEKLH